MNTLHILYVTIFCGLLYLWLKLKNKEFRILIPSIIHTGIWTIVCILIACTMLGYIGEYFPDIPAYSYDKVVPFILGIMLSSIIGFSLAHITSSDKNCTNKTKSLNIKKLEYVLHKYHWIRYICAVLGLMQIAFLLSVVGWQGLADYRITAVSINRTGFGAFSQQFSGHASILGGFYIGLLGCKHGISGINIKLFIYTALLTALPNIAIAGRGWIIATMLPYIVGYFWQKKIHNKKLFDRDTKKILTILLSFLVLFSIIGSIRNQTEGSGLEKFLYLTDGSRIANLVLTLFPDGSFNYEYGGAEFLSKWINSPMYSTYRNLISDDVGLRVTVASSLVPLYFDFGFWGGIIMWGIFCFIIEKNAIKLLNTNSILGAIIFIELCKILFQSPVGPIFTMNIPVFEWIVILYILKTKLLPKNIK